MPRLSPIKPRVLTKFLKNHGFVEIRQRGSHVFFKHADGRTTVIPNHPRQEIRPSLLRKILSDTKISPQEFLMTKK